MESEIINDLKKWIEKATGENVILERPNDNNHGDFSTNIALIVAKKEKKNPKEVANKIVEELMENLGEMEKVKKIEVAGAGFVNIFLKNDFLIKEIEKINYENEFREKLNKYGQNKTLVIDYSAPNIAKPFGIGHLRSTNIGQAIYNTYKILGWKCIGDNHIGDWGTQFGKLIVAIKKYNKKKIENLTVEDLEKMYVQFHKDAETDENLVIEGRKWFEKLENGDKEARDIWQKCIDISWIEFNRVYELLGVKIDNVLGESFYEDKLKAVTEEIIEKGITKESENAVIIEFDDMPPAMLTKSDGTTTYFGRDLATIKYRKKTWNPDLVIYEVGADQALHFRQLFRVVEMMGWMNGKKLVHIAHGLIRWKGGKFSTRKGDTIHLSDVIEKAREKAKSMAKEINNESIEKIAIGAIKFSDLATDPRKDVIFDWDKVMSLEGNSGPYLQYTYVRAKSVLDKSRIDEQKNIFNIPISLAAAEEKMVRELSRFEEKIVESANRYSPAVLAEYLLNMARSFNEFYENNRIIDSEEEDFRIFLTKVVTSVLKTGLKILGIETVEKM